MYSILSGQLVGKSVEIDTIDNHYEGVLKMVEGNVAVIFDEDIEKDVYINLLLMEGITLSDEEEHKIPKKKKGLFGRKNDGLEGF